MDWIEIQIETTSRGAEPVGGLILMAGVSGWVIDDPEDIRRYLEGPQAARWDYVDESLLRDPRRGTLIRAYVADDGQGRRQWERLHQGLLSLREEDREGLFGSLSWRMQNVKEEDWANNWKAFFKPFAVGGKLAVKPTWETWDGGDGRIVVEIDPGSSFGTGQHHTTRMCLELMEHLVKPGMRMLDIGCGSGILMAAGLLLGAGFAVGVDVEEHALRTAEGNLRQNGIAPERYALFTGDVISQSGLRRVIREAVGSVAGDAGAGGAKDAAGADNRVGDDNTGGVDLVVANIVADVILDMARHFGFFLKRPGSLLVSGIIDDRREEVTRRLTEAGFVLEESRQSGEWNALVFSASGA